MKAIVNNNELDFEVINRTANSITISMNGREFFFSKDELSLNITKLHNEDNQVFDGNLEAYAQILSKAKSAQSSTVSEGSLLSPMPGKIFKVLKNQGDKVSKGEVILIMEAMKMEHSIKATADGKVKQIFFKEGEQVSGQSLLCELE